MNIINIITDITNEVEHFARGMRNLLIFGGPWHVVYKGVGQKLLKR